MRITSRMPASAALLACAVLLSGCIAIAVPDAVPTRAPLTAEPQPDPEETATTPPPAPAADVVDCAGAPVQVQAGTVPRVIEGDCPSVTVEGNDARVHLVEAEVGSLVVRGDRLDIAAGNIGTLEIGGQDNHLVAVVIGAIGIRGDRNIVDVSDDVDSADVSGNDNIVTAASIDSIAVSGGGNQVGTR